MRQVKKEGLRSPGRLIDKLHRELRNEIGLVTADLRQSERLTVAVKRRVPHFLEIIARPGVSRAAKIPVYKFVEILRIVPFLRRRHVQPAGGAGAIAAALQQFKQRHTAVIEQPGPVQDADLMRVQPGHERRA